MSSLPAANTALVIVPISAIHVRNGLENWHLVRADLFNCVNSPQIFRMIIKIEDEADLGHAQLTALQKTLNVAV